MQIISTKALYLHKQKDCSVYPLIMLSKPQIRTVTSLQHKKFRREHGLFIVEGIKSVTEFLQSDYIVQHIFYTPQAAAKLIKIPQNIKSDEVSGETLERISALKTPQGVLALV